jgi:hypothetical protein
MKGVNISPLDPYSIKGEISEIIANEIQKSMHEHNITGKVIGFCGDKNDKKFDVSGLRRGRSNVIKNLKHRMKREIIERGCCAHILQNCIHGSCDVLPVEVESLVVKNTNTFSHAQSSCSELECYLIKVVPSTKFE